MSATHLQTLLLESVHQSLKEGMLKNKNATFPTTFVGGVSSATKTVGQLEVEDVRC